MPKQLVAPWKRQATGTNVFLVIPKAFKAQLARSVKEPHRHGANGRPDADTKEQKGNRLIA